MAISANERDALIKNYEDQEPSYWATKLGKQAALEVLSLSRTSTNTMEMMSNLPMDEFEESVRVCTKYTTLITQSIESVERSMSSITAGLPEEGYYENNSKF